jgi:hypothetical protein
MSKVRNMVRTIAKPGTEEFDLPKGWKLSQTHFLGITNDEERKVMGFGYKILYVLVPDFPEVVPAQRGRPPLVKNE